MEDSFQRIHIWVKGRVQGVGFRAFVVQSASLLGLTGWVRNVDWDQVETIAEGRPPILEKYLEMVRSGPGHSRVSEARFEVETATGEFKDFTIL